MNQDASIASQPQRWLPWTAALLVAGITFLAFAHSLECGFVRWDDDISFYHNPKLGGLDWQHVRWAFTDIGTTRWWMPLTLLSWACTYQVCGLSPWGYHLGNCLLHAANAALLFFVLLEILHLTGGTRSKNPQAKPDRRGPPWRSWRPVAAAALGALFWSLHPLRVESVTWSVCRGYGLASFFGLLSVLAYLLAQRPEAMSGDRGRTRRFLVLSVVCYLAALLSHPLAAGVLIVLIVLDWYPLGKLGPGRGWWTPGARSALLGKLPYVAAALAITVVSVYAKLTHPGAWQAHAKPPTLAEFGLLPRLMQACYVWVYYLVRPFYPIKLAPVYTELISFDPRSSLFLFCAAALVAVSLVVLLLYRRWPILAALWLCHLALMIPALGLLEHPHFANDRYSVLASMIWSVLLAAWLANARMTSAARNAAWAVAVLVVVALSALCVRQTYVWTDSQTLLQHTIANLGRDPYRAVIYERLSWVYREENKAPQAEAALSEAVAIDPGKLALRMELGELLLGERRYREACEHFGAAVELAPHSVDAHFCLAAALWKSHDQEAAIAQLRLALAIDPHHQPSLQLLDNLTRGRG